MARMFGLSRTRAADLIAEGHVSVDGAAVGQERPGARRARCSTSTIPAAADPLAVVPEMVEGIKIVHDDDVDRGASTSRSASPCTPRPGWTGPDRRRSPRRRRASGSPPAAPPSGRGSCSASTSAPPGVMVICKSEHAYSVLKNAFRHRTVDKIYHALVQGHPDPLEGTIDAPIGRHPKHDYKFAVMADGRHSVTHYETLEAHRFASLLEVHLETGRTHQIRVHMARAEAPLRRRPHLRRRPDAGHAGSGSSGSGCTPCGSASSTPTPASTSSTSRTTPTTSQHALDTLRDAV